MGYYTDFGGCFDITPPVSNGDAAEFRDFTHQNHRRDDGLPSIWCDFFLGSIRCEGGFDALFIEDGKNYGYTDWCYWLVANFFKPKGYTLNGTVYWYGEERDDLGCIEIEDNHIRVGYGTVVYDWEE